jgi:hypothetical protein
MKYQVIKHTGHDWSLEEQDFDTLNQAVDYGIKNSYGSDFKIIQIVSWEAKEIDI